ncbi:DUF6331 family protein [Ochrobactrum sp. BTU1]|uniref:DUF6331 family protein n=1 Tax=Ochrobactrum sp. BTU1 TaxID=2840456 RepID=UPI00207B2763
MKLDYPLLGLIKQCETVCEATCCGRDAFDFSPIHMASFLLRYNCEIDVDQIEQINSQLASLKRESIDAIKNEKVITIDEMNQIFTGEQLAEICSELSDNLLLAPKIVSFAEKLLENLPQSASD